MDEEKKAVKKRNVLKIVFSVLALILLIAVYFTLKSMNEKEEETEDETAEEVLSISEKDIEKISFELSDQTVTFEKQDDKWVYAKDKNFPVNEEKIQEIAEGFESVISTRKLTDVESLSEYGLDDDSDQKIIVYTGEDEKRTIQIGDMNDTTQSYYARIDGVEDTIYMINSSFVSLFGGKFYDYAEAGIFPVISTDEIDEIQVNKSKDSYALKASQDVSSGWLIEAENISEEADSSEASQAATSVNSLSYLDFVNYNCEDYSKYGLDQPQAEILVKYHQEVETEEEDSESDAEDNENEEKETKTENKEILLKIGNADGENYYVCVDNSKEIYTMSSTSLENLLEKTVSDYWNLKVNYYPITGIKSIDVEHGEEKDALTIERETDDEGEEEYHYYINDKEADEDNFKNFFNGLVNISAKERLEENYQANGTPEWKFTFEDEDGREEVSYYVYDENFYVAVKNNGVSYLINKLDVTNLDNLLKKLKNGGDGEK